MINNSASIDPNEIEKFSAMAEEWWDPQGKFKPLHAINPVRIRYLLENIGRIFTIEIKHVNPLKGLKILDIGCGGGLLSEPFARLGADVMSIDASEKNIKIASLHAEKMGIDINYRCISVEELAKESLKFDVILNMEVIEHVNDVNSFMEHACMLLKEKSIMFISTINKTLKAYMLAIVAAEYILNWLPKGTHEYSKFLTPATVAKLLRANNLQIENIKGLSYNLFKNEWFISEDIDVNYIITARNS
ncbi:MAG: bifunctional 2-polyprenyl-6-hydroxyphenol methylase/3-demethylubiquinol 3-O-methyltransferase UbiG [Alphaproteobacteria bacterium]